jgi:hypothetical protein
MMMLVPLTMMAHEGHGLSGNDLIHLMVSHNYMTILIAIGLVSLVIYRLRIREKK